MLTPPPSSPLPPPPPPPLPDVVQSHNLRNKTQGPSLRAGLDGKIHSLRALSPPPPPPPPPIFHVFFAFYAISNISLKCGGGLGGGGSNVFLAFYAISKISRKNTFWENWYPGCLFVMIMIIIYMIIRVSMGMQLPCLKVHVMIIIYMIILVSMGTRLPCLKVHVIIITYNNNHIHNYTNKYIHDYTGERGDAASLPKGTYNDNIKAPKQDHSPHSPPL